jgi:hypothetical protein
MTATLEGALSRLESNTLLPLSMASRELFHSNLIEWLVRKHPKAGVEVAKSFGLTVPRGTQVWGTREVGLPKAGKIDLHLEVERDDQLIEESWIEIKVGAYPRQDQIARYDKALDERDEREDKRLERAAEKAGLSHRSPRRKRALVSMIKPSLHSSSWDVFTLGQLAEIVSAAARKVPAGFDRELVKREASLLADLAALGTALEVEPHLDEPFFLSMELDERIRNIRLQTIVEKSRMASLLSHVNHQLDTSGGVEHVVGKVEMFHGYGVIDFQYWPDEVSGFGWQLERRQYRHFGTLDDYQSVDRGPVYVRLRQLDPAWFDDFVDAGRVVPGLDPATPEPFKSSGGYSDGWGYVYKHIPPDITIREVVDLLMSETLRLESIATERREGGPERAPTPS